MMVMGGLGALVFRSRPVQTDIGKFINQDIALYNGLEKMTAEVKANPNASSVTTHFRGPHPAKKDESEFWSYNRRLGVLVGFFYVQKNTPGAKPQKSDWKYKKVVCDKTDDARLETLKSKGAFVAAAPTEYGCREEDPRQIGGKLPDQITQKAKP